MANQWFKFYGGEYLSDPKMLALTACERSCWLTLLCYASMSSDGVIRFLNEGQLMAQAGINFNEEEWIVTKGVLDHLQELGMIRQSNGEITILNWQKRQESYLTNAERQARFREKRKSNAKVTKESNESNARIEENRIEENRDIIEQGFNEFWEMYPRKIGKKAAMKVWFRLKLTPELRDKITSALKQHTKSEQWEKDAGRFVPHAATWLNGERWDDELKGGKARSTKYDAVRTTTIRK